MERKVRPLYDAIDARNWKVRRRGAGGCGAGRQADPLRDAPAPITAHSVGRICSYLSIVPVAVMCWASSGIVHAPCAGLTVHTAEPPLTRPTGPPLLPVPGHGQAWHVAPAPDRMENGAGLRVASSHLLPLLLF